MFPNSYGMTCVFPSLLIFLDHKNPKEKICRIWTLATEFWLCWIKLCSNHNHYTMAMVQLQKEISQHLKSSVKIFFLIFCFFFVFFSGFIKHLNVDEGPFSEKLLFLSKQGKCTIFGLKMNTLKNFSLNRFINFSWNYT